MNHLQLTVFNQVFDRIADYLPTKDVARVAQCSTDLNSCVKSLSHCYWGRQIAQDITYFPNKIAVEWIKKAKNSKLAAITYIALRFLGSPFFKQNELLNYAGTISFLPAPALCTLLNQLSFTSNTFYKDFSAIWEAIPQTDRQLFYEFMAGRALDMAAMGHNNLPKVEIYLDFLERGLINLILMRPESKTIIHNLLLYFCETTTHSGIDQLLILPIMNQVDLKQCLTSACKQRNHYAVKQLLDAGAQPSWLSPQYHFIFSEAGLHLLRMLTKYGDFQKQIKDHLPSLLSAIDTLEKFQILHELNIYTVGQLWNGNSYPTLRIME